MKPEVKKLITGIGTGVIGIVVAILEYKFSEMPAVANVVIDLVAMVGGYLGLHFGLKNA